VATPSEIEAAIEVGCRELEFFPAESTGGMKNLPSMMAPYAQLGLRFIPLGGLNAQNMAAYLDDPSILAIGGSWNAPRELIRREDWPAITANAAEARDIVENRMKGVAP
jgi:2-dehydro-3-deoxyphosphogluconate aldolase/(4S)-4-hydroxy-2-oxoglutarate aldolase